MITILQDLPEGTVGIAAKGEISDKDYTNVVAPAIEGALEKHGTAKLLFYMPDFEGVELQAIWNDAGFGLAHWQGIAQVAFVTDAVWIKNMAAFFARMIPAGVRCFSTRELDQACKWLEQKEVEKEKRKAA